MKYLTMIGIFVDLFLERLSDGKEKVRDLGLEVRDFMTIGISNFLNNKGFDIAIFNLRASEKVRNDGNDGAENIGENGLRKQISKS